MRRLCAFLFLIFAMGMLVSALLSNVATTVFFGVWLIVIQLEMIETPH